MYKNLLILLLVSCSVCNSTLAAVMPQSSKVKKGTPLQEVQIQKPVPSPVQPQPVAIEACSKFFKLDSQKLFLLTLAGVNANRFEIKEIQSKSVYVLFSVAQRQFLASVVNIDAKNSMLKITPCNNLYYFPIGIVQNMFKYIELNANTAVEKLGVL